MSDYIVSSASIDHPTTNTLNNATRVTQKPQTINPYNVTLASENSGTTAENDSTLTQNTIINSSDVTQYALTYMVVSSGVLDITDDTDLSSINRISVTDTGIVNGSSQSGYPAFFVENGGVVNIGTGSFSGYIDNNGTIKASNLNYDGSTASTSTTGSISMTSGATLDVGYGVNVLFHEYSGGTINIQSGGYTSSLIYMGYGGPNDSVCVYSGGFLDGRNELYNSTTILSGGSANTIRLGYTNNALITVDGTVNRIELGSIHDDGTVNLGGSAIINSGGIVSSLVAYNSGNVTFNAGASLTGDLTLNDGAKVTITTSTGGTIDLVGDTNAGLTIYASAAAGQNISVTTTINNFSGVTEESSDLITLADINQNDITTVTFPDNDHITLTLSDNSSITLNIPNIQTTGYSLGTNNSNELTLQVCFLTGTMIEIPDGVCAVEDLKIGDIVVTYNPVTKTKTPSSIKWVGHKKTSAKSNLHKDEAGYPVRILKDAITENVPNKDLLITAEHCLYFDGKFIPARMLVNSYSIYYDTSITSYDYYHIETAEHSILTADGMLTESYLDTGNRHIFNQDHKIVELSGKKEKTWQKDAIAPLTVERSIVETIYKDILQRAHAQGPQQQNESIQITLDPDLYLVTDKGETISKEISSTDKKVNFIIPNSTNSVWIISRASRPCDVIGSFIDDRRYLGVLVGDVTLQTNDKIHHITTHTEADHLLGWDIKETIHCRWTKGKALLPLNIKSHSNTTTILTLNILSDHAYHAENTHEKVKQTA